MKRIICLYGGPGTGKSTTASGVFYKLKLKNYNCELNREYIKDWAWEGRSVKPGDQTYFFAKQARKERLYMENGCDFIITDSPLVLMHFYGLKYDKFEQSQNTSLMMLRHHHEICKTYGYKVEHYFLHREKPYQTAGRFQKEYEAKLIDVEIKDMLDNLNIKYNEIAANDMAVDYIVQNLTQTKHLVGVPV